MFEGILQFLSRNNAQAGPVAKPFAKIAPQFGAEAPLDPGYSSLLGQQPFNGFGLFNTGWDRGYRRKMFDVGTTISQIGGYQPMIPLGNPFGQTYGGNPFAPPDDGRTYEPHPHNPFSHRRKKQPRGLLVGVLQGPLLSRLPK